MGPGAAPGPPIFSNTCATNEDYITYISLIHLVYSSTNGQPVLTEIFRYHRYHPVETIPIPSPNALQDP
jgi:hypothetical protein